MKRVYHGGTDPANGGYWFEEPAPVQVVKLLPITCYKESNGTHRPVYRFLSFIAALARHYWNFISNQG